MRIVTINTGKCDGSYRRRLELLAAGLAALDPDVVALQEAFVACDGSADTAAYVARRLGLHASAARARRKPRTVEGRTGPGTLPGLRPEPCSPAAATPEI